MMAEPDPLERNLATLRDTVTRLVSRRAGSHSTPSTASGTPNSTLSTAPGWFVRLFGSRKR